MKRLRDDTGEAFGEVMQAIRESIEEILGKLGQRLREMEDQEIIRYAHSLKSPCSNLGAHRMFEMAVQLEQSAKQGMMDEVVAVVELLQHESQHVWTEIDRLDALPYQDL